MTDHDAIRDLLATYAMTLDVDDIDGCLALFTDDAEFVVFGKTLSGHDRIRKMLTRAPRGMHLGGALLVDVDGQQATVRSQVLFVDSSTHELRPALYDDALIKTNGHWRFRCRRCRFITKNGLTDRLPEEAP
jgi:uncharacterized protein (TIGR02246 family)